MAGLHQTFYHPISHKYQQYQLHVFCLGLHGFYQVNEKNDIIIYKIYNIIILQNNQVPSVHRRI